MKAHWSSIWRWIAIGVIAVISLIMGSIAWWLWTDYQHQLAFKPAGQIAYECWPERLSSRICLINTDGTGYRVLISPSKEVSAWAWAPNGKQGLYVYPIFNPSTTADVDSIFKINIDGTNAIQLTDASSNSGVPAWSPDGNYIAFAKYRESNPQNNGVYLIRSDGSAKVQLTKGGLYPTWSPDNTQIAYAMYAGSDIGDSRIYVIDVDGSKTVRLTNVYSRSPAWSPDGNQIAFICIMDNATGICTINKDGSGLKMIVKSGFYAIKSEQISWSPDGEYIAYATTNPSCFLCNITGLLWITKADGSYQRQLTKNSEISLSPAWRPVK